MEPADVLIWTLRILLPIILFCRRVRRCRHLSGAANPNVRPQYVTADAIAQGLGDPQWDASYSVSCALACALVNMREPMLARECAWACENMHACVCVRKVPPRFA